MTSLAEAVMPERKHAHTCTIKGKVDDSRTMQAVEWYGTKDIRVVDAPRPLITDPTDAILRVTASAICGSDLHMYLGQVSGMKKSDILGHEFVGDVVEVGSEVKSVKRGDHVVAAFAIACGECFYCKQGQYTSCETTNVSKEAEALYGHHTGGIYGYTHMTGGYSGGQAEYVRVPFADVGLLKVPHGMKDTSAVLLADVLPTAWFGCELGEVGPGDRVAVWGAGPVGQLAAHCAFARGASRVVLIDEWGYRLEHAKKGIKNGSLETINFKESKVYETLMEKFGTGPDVAIEAVGLHYAKSWIHRFEMALKLETDPSETINELMRCVRKGGRIAILGVYMGYANHFNIGAFMEKGLSMRAGQAPVQKYWKGLLKMVENGKLSPEFVVTHTVPLEEAPDAYKVFNEKQDEVVKVVMCPASTAAAAKEE